MALLGSAGESSAAGCIATDVRACSGTQICKNATVPNGSVRKWKPYQSVFKDEAKKRGLNCVAKAVRATPLRAAFTKLSNDQRKLVQSNLADLSYYKFSIDGLYGKGTAKALTEYNRVRLTVKGCRSATSTHETISRSIEPPLLLSGANHCAHRFRLR